MNNPINPPKIPSLGLKFSFPIHKFQTWKLAQKILTTDMRDSKSWTEILIFNHHLSGPMKSYNEFFFFLQRHIYDEIPIEKIYLLLLSIKKRTATVPKSSFVYPSFFLPHFDTILHIAVISIFI